MSSIGGVPPLGTYTYPLGETQGQGTEQPSPRLSLPPDPLQYLIHKQFQNWARDPSPRSQKDLIQKQLLDWPQEQISSQIKLMRNRWTQSLKRALRQDILQRILPQNEKDQLFQNMFTYLRKDVLENSLQNRSLQDQRLPVTLQELKPELLQRTLQTHFQEQLHTNLEKHIEHYAPKIISILCEKVIREYRPELWPEPLPDSPKSHFTLRNYVQAMQGLSPYTLLVHDLLLPEILPDKLSGLEGTPLPDLFQNLFPGLHQEQLQEMHQTLRQSLLHILFPKLRSNPNPCSEISSSNLHPEDLCYGCPESLQCRLNTFLLNMFYLEHRRLEETLPQILFKDVMDNLRHSNLRAEPCLDLLLSAPIDLSPDPLQGLVQDLCPSCPREQISNHIQLMHQNCFRSLKRALCQDLFQDAYRELPQDLHQALFQGVGEGLQGISLPEPFSTELKKWNPDHLRAMIHTRLQTSLPAWLKRLIRGQIPHLLPLLRQNLIKSLHLYIPQLHPLAYDSFCHSLLSDLLPNLLPGLRQTPLLDLLRSLSSDLSQDVLHERHHYLRQQLLQTLCPNLSLDLFQRELAIHFQELRQKLQHKLHQSVLVSLNLPNQSVQILLHTGQIFPAPSGQGHNPLTTIKHIIWPFRLLVDRSPPEDPPELAHLYLLQLP